MNAFKMNAFIYYDFKMNALNGLETKISRTFLDFLHLGHEFFVISGHGT